MSPELRGHGLGRRIMEELEHHASSIGITSLHLSTHDKVHFYSHLGYKNGPVVSPLRKCIAVLQNQVGSYTLFITNIKMNNPFSSYSCMILNRHRYSMLQ